MMSGRLGAGPLRGITRSPSLRAAASELGSARGMSALLLLRTVAAAGLLTVLHALGVQRATHDLVADAGEVLHAAAADEHDRVLLQVVADAGDVRRDLDAAGEADTRDLAQRRVRLLRGRRVHAGAHAAPLRAPLERRGLGLADLVLAALADQLLDRGHRFSVFCVWCCSSCCWVVLLRPTWYYRLPVARATGPRARACRP